MNHKVTQIALALALGLGLFTSVGASAAPPSSPAAGPAGDSDIPKINTDGMTPSERDTLKRLLQKFPSACGKSHSLLTSLRSDPGCNLSVHAARWMAKLLSDGFLESEVDEKYTRRFVDAKCYQIDVTGAHVRGDPAAPISLVEFADFECPHCGMTDPVLVQLLAKYKNVKLIFMNYPIPNHLHAATAAAAALAAGKQGKFWEYHDKLFKNQNRLSQTDLVLYAQELKLDTRRFQGDIEAMRSRVKRERDIGEKLELTGTPALFINCRKIEMTPTLENLSSYVEAEMSR